MSRNSVLLLAAFLLMPGVFSSQAQPSAPSALTTLRGFARERGDEEASRIVGVVGFFGQDQPGQWLLLQKDVKVPNLLHEYAIRNGRLVAQRQFWRDPKQDMPSIPIVISQIAIDSTAAFRLADQQAKRAGVGFDSIHYQLRCRDLRNEPIWVLNLVDSLQKSVGVLYISALTGETLRSAWYRTGTTTSNTSPQPSAPTHKRPKGLIPQLADRIREERNGATQPPPPPGFSAPPVPPRSGR